MTVAWDLCRGWNWRTKPCVVPTKVAAGGDERHFVCAAVAAAIVPSANPFSIGVLQRVVVLVAHVRVIIVVFCGG